MNGDGSSVLKATRGVVPVKFTRTQYDAPTCGLLPAVAGGTLGAIDESTYVANADSGPDSESMVANTPIILQPLR
jgi:hypothetical protein